MAKRSNYERIDRDYYRTWDPRAYPPILAHLAPETRFEEPCAGDGVMVDALESFGHICVKASDIEPQRKSILKRDSFTITESNADFFITNHPYNGKRYIRINEHETRPNPNHDLGTRILLHLSMIKPTSSLLPADYAHNSYFTQFKDQLVRVVSVGRLKLIEGSKSAGNDNYAWYLLDKPMPNRQTTFHMRAT